MKNFDTFESAREAYPDAQVYLHFPQFRKNSDWIPDESAVKLLAVNKACGREIKANRKIIHIDLFC